jgi:hypothetical protein
MSKLLPKLLMGASAAAFAGLAGCSSVSEFTKQEVTRSESSVQQAQGTVGTSEAGAVELQRAKDKLSQAQAALKKEDDKQAQRLATEAKLEAELAVAKSQSANARKAADELLASIETLRREANRGAVSSQ